MLHQHKVELIKRAAEVKAVTLPWTGRVDREPTGPREARPDDRLREAVGVG